MTKITLTTSSLFKHNLMSYNSVAMWDNAVTTVITEMLRRLKGNLLVMVAKLAYL